ncbi:GPW/gp25 family protein [Ensifer canadensis]
MKSAIHIDYPYRAGPHARTATTDRADQIRDMLTLLLFTRPGERVMRPDFGTGLTQHVFSPNSPELAATIQLTMQAAIQRWLGDVLELRALDVTAQDSELRVEISYVVAATGEQRDEVLVGGAP